MDDKKLSIYICGAHCSGKTTLQKSLQKHPEFEKLQFKIQKEIARSWMKKNGYTKEYLRNRDAFFKLQKDLLGLQALEERREISEPSANCCRFLWDRGIIDPIVYVKEVFDEEEANKCLEIPSVKHLIKRWKCGNNVLVFVPKPDKSFLENDSIRMEGDFNDMLKMYKSTIKLLEDIGIKHIAIDELDLTKRTEIVLEKVKEKWPQILV